MNYDDDLSEGERDVGALNAIKANYIEKIIVSSRIAETSSENPATHHSNSQHHGKASNLIPQLSRVPLFVENGRPTSSASGNSHANTAPQQNNGASVQSDSLHLISEGKSIKGRNSPPRPPTSSTPSRVGTASRPKTSSRVVSTPNAQGNPNQTLTGTAPPATLTNAPAITNVSPVKQANIENRILIRLANMLPVDNDSSNEQHTSPTNDHHQQSQYNHNGHNISQFTKLPESRNMLLRLNHDLDDITSDIRNWSLELDRFNFGDMQQHDGARSKDYTSGASLDNNPLVFDQVIAELSGQASKKVVRIKKMYRNQMQKLKKQYDKHVAELKVQADALSSRLFESQLKSESLSDALQTVEGGGDGKKTSAAENDALAQHQRLVKVLREEQDSMQEVLLRRLENERKVKGFVSLFSIFFV